MRFPVVFDKICFYVFVFYSACFISKRSASRILPAYRSDADDDFVRLYITAGPKMPTPLHPFDNRPNYGFLAWISILSVVLTIAIIVCICILFWKLYPKYRRRRSTNAALVPPSRQTIVTFQAGPPHMDVGTTNPNATAGNIYSTTGTVNFAFTSSVQDGSQSPGDGPPAYTTVVSEASSDEKTQISQYPRVPVLKVVETPPPAYITVAPFQ